MGESTTCGYYISKDDDKKAAFAALCAEVECNIEPCAKTLDEFKKYITKTKGMMQVPMSEGEKKSRKAQFIARYRPDLLSTPMLELPTDRIPTSQEMTAMMNSQAKRFKEAMGIPMEKTGFMFTKYITEQYVAENNSYKVEVILEENSYNFMAEGQGSEKNDTELRRFIDDIVIFRGVTEEDIRTKSECYVSYEATKASRLSEERK